MLLMFSSTFLLGCLPGYNTIGVLAPLLLTLLRIFQGLSVGGQFVGSILFLVGMKTQPFCFLLFVICYLLLIYICDILLVAAFSLCF